MCKMQEVNTTVRRPKRAAFVTYASREEAEQAFQLLGNAFRDWVISWDMSVSDAPTPNTDMHTLFVGGLNRKLVTKNLLKERFQQYGNVVAIDLILNENDERNRSAFAFVRYAEAYSAPHAIEAENASEWLAKRIRVQFCEPPDVKQRRRSSQMAIPMGFMRPMDTPVPAYTNYYMMAPTPDYSSVAAVPTAIPIGSYQTNEGIPSFGYAGYDFGNGYIPHSTMIPVPAAPQAYTWHLAAPNMLTAYRPNGTAHQFMVYPHPVVSTQTPASIYGSSESLDSLSSDMRNLQEGMNNVRLQ